MARKDNDVQASRDIRRAEERLARQQGHGPSEDARSLRVHAATAGLSLHAAALGVLADDVDMP